MGGDPYREGLLLKAERRQDGRRKTESPEDRTAGRPKMRNAMSLLLLITFNP